MLLRESDGRLIIKTNINKKPFKYRTGDLLDINYWSNEHKSIIVPKGVKGRLISLLSKRISDIISDIQNYKDDVKFKNLETDFNKLRNQLDVKYKGKEVKSDNNLISLLDAFKEYYNYSKLRVRPSTLKRKEYLNNNLETYYPNHLLKDVNAKFIDDLTTKTLNRGVQNRTINAQMSQFKAFLNWCKSRGYIKDVPKFKRFKESETDDISLTWDELQLLKKFNGSKFENEIRDLFLIGVLSGQRYSDYSVFNKSDLQAGFLIRRAKKTLEKTYIPIHNDSLPYLKKILDSYDWDLPIYSVKLFNIHIRKVAKKSGIKGEHKKYENRSNESKPIIKKRADFISSHTARRTFITLSLDNGINPMIVMKQVGISKIETLTKYYKFDKEAMIGQIGNVWNKF